MFALQELLDLVKMSGCSLIVWLKDKVMIQCYSVTNYISKFRRLEDIRTSLIVFYLRSVYLAGHRLRVL